jgi:uncharacterized protein (TIGR03382 family)
VTATNQFGTGTMVIHLDDGVLTGDTWTWTMNGPRTVRDSVGNAIATIRMMDCFLGGDPQANVRFDVEAGNATTAFTISSGLVSFAPIPNAVGRASASITLTDLNGDGATLTGQEPGGRAYRASYNGLAPGGSTFATLIAGPNTTGVFSSSTFSESNPAGPGFVAVGATVEDMSARYNFTLSANDSASGTSVFVITPAPASAGLLGLAGLASLRRRRR